MQINKEEFIDLDCYYNFKHAINEARKQISLARRYLRTEDEANKTERDAHNITFIAQQALLTLTMEDD